MIEEKIETRLLMCDDGDYSIAAVPESRRYGQDDESQGWGVCTIRLASIFHDLFSHIDEDMFDDQSLAELGKLCPQELKLTVYRDEPDHEHAVQIRSLGEYRSTVELLTPDGVYHRAGLFAAAYEWLCSYDVVDGKTHYITLEVV